MEENKVIKHGKYYFSGKCQIRCTRCDCVFNTDVVIHNRGSEVALTRKESCPECKSDVWLICKNENHEAYPNEDRKVYV